MKLLIFISLFGGLLLASCGSSSSQKNASTQEVNPADTIYLGDLREKFEGDSIFFKVVAPDLMLMDYQYFWAATESEAVEKGLTKEYYKRVKKEISETNYKRQNKLFHFHKTFCSEFDIINTKQNVHFTKVVSPIFQFCLSLHQFSIGAKVPFINKRD